MVPAGARGLVLPGRSDSSPAAAPYPFVNRAWQSGRDPRIAVLHPGAAYPARRWPAQRFASVARWARLQGLEVRITGSTQERDLARSVAVQAGLGPDAVVASSTSVEDLAALISQARSVVSGDTGIAHLAFAYATPSITLYGPISPALWGPPDDGPHRTLWSGVASNEPFAPTADAALLSIGSADVVEAAEALSGTARSRHRPPPPEASGRRRRSALFVRARRPTRPAASNPAAREPATPPGSAPQDPLVAGRRTGSPPRTR